MPTENEDLASRVSQSGPVTDVTEEVDRKIGTYEDNVKSGGMPKPSRSTTEPIRKGG